MGSDHASRRKPRHFTGSASLRGMVRDKSFLFGIIILGLGRVWAEEEGAAKEGGSDKADFSVAVMLFASVIFMMMTFYLVNNHDIDIQYAAWKTISAMISIFSAVLTYSAMNNVLMDTFVSAEQQNDQWHQFKVLIAFALLWYVFFQLFLAFISGAIGGDMPADATKEEKKKIGEKCLLNVDCFAVLCGHISGFSFIRAFAVLQCWQVKENEGFQLGMALIIILVTWGCLQALFAIFDRVREKITFMDDGEEDDFELIWDMGTEETENDVLGLTMSFLHTQVLRFLIWGKLPNEEGEFEGEEGKEEARRLSEGDTNRLHQGLLLIGIGSGVMMFVIFLDLFDLWPKWPNKYGAPEEERVYSWIEPEKEEEGKEPEEPKAEWYTRLQEQVMGTAAMTFAWCFFFGAQACQIPDEEHKAMNAVILALAITGIAYALIFVVDKVRDRKDLPGAGKKIKFMIDEACNEVIDALGLVVGFAWEKCFDAAVEVIVDKESEAGYNPRLLRFALTGMICLILVPGWRYHILPRQDQIKELVEEAKKEEEEEVKRAGQLEQEKGHLENNLGAPLTSPLPGV